MSTENISSVQLKFFTKNYQEIIAIEQNILGIAKTFVNVFKEVQEITLLPKEHHENALRDLEKRSKACSEQWMHSLESLDNIKKDDNELCNAKRKSVVDCVNSYMGK